MNMISMLLIVWINWAKPDRFPVTLNNTEDLPHRKIRIAYLMKGIVALNSVLMKINLLFAKYHNKSIFEVSFYVPETELSVLNSPQGKGYKELFESYDTKLIAAPNIDDEEKKLLAVSKNIYDNSPDILITNAALVDFSHYFITSLRPAPITIGLVYGPPPQYAPLILDWSISAVKHPLMDCPVDCSLINLEFELPNRKDTVAYTKTDINLPHDAFILMSAGRFPKFQNQEFWKSIHDILIDHPGVYYVAIGVEENQISFLRNVLSPETTRRVRFLGWRADYLNFLILADVVLDTYPSGGGVVLVDAMSLGIPIVSFRMTI